MERLFHCFQESRFGPVAVLWSIHHGQPLIRRVVLSRPEWTAREAVAALFPDAVLSSGSEVVAVAEGIAAFLEGGDILFSLAVTRLDLCPPFQQRVLQAEHGIPRGSVSTYGRIASRLGDGKAARAVGMALARNPFPIIVPCHRAIRSDGTLGGFQGGQAMKRALLEMEGVVLDGAGRVTAVPFFY